MIHDLPDGAIRMTVAITTPAVYLFIKDNRVIYVGQTENLSRRLASHKRMRGRYDSIFFLPATEDCQMRRAQEAILINRYNPIHNCPVRAESETQESFEERGKSFRDKYIINPTPGIQVRIGGRLAAIIVESARKNCRSVAGETNYALRQYYGLAPKKQSS